MTKLQFSQAIDLIRAGDLPVHDDLVLHGCGLPGFVPVTVTLEVAASFIRYQCLMFNGQFDSEALNETAGILRRKATI